MKKNKNQIGTLKGFFALLLSMLFYSLSGLMVVWLGYSFNPGGQLVVRALIALFISIVWIVVTKTGFGLHGKYSKKMLFLDIVTRPIFNFCFIMAIYGFKEATFAILLLFGAKVVTGGLIATFVNKIKLCKYDIVSYLFVIVGIVVYNLGGGFQLAFLWAVASGILEAIKSEAMSRLKIESIDMPAISFYEFAGVVISGLLISLFLDGGALMHSALQPQTYWGMIIAITAVLALFLELYGFSNFSSDLGNIVLATELGVAGVINHFFLGTSLEIQKIFSLVIFVIVAVFVAKAGRMRSTSEKRLNIEVKRDKK